MPKLHFLNFYGELVDSMAKRLKSAIFIVSAALALLLMISCSSKTEKKISKDAIARAGDRELYPIDLEGLVPEGTNPEDSVEIVRQFTGNWLREELLLQQANDLLNDEEQSIEKEVAWYKRQLLLKKIEEKLKSEADTNYTQAELDSFFRANPSLFSLTEPVFKGRFLVLPVTAPRLNWTEKVIRSRNKREIEQLNDYCLRFARHTHLNDSAWFSAESVFKNGSESFKSKINNLAPGQLIKYIDSSTVYMVWVAGFRRIGETAPFDYAQWNTRKLLLLHKQNQHLYQTQEALYQKALKNKSIETINP